MSKNKTKNEQAAGNTNTAEPAENALNSNQPIGETDLSHEEGTAVNNPADNPADNTGNESLDFGEEKVEMTETKIGENTIVHATSAGKGPDEKQPDETETEIPNGPGPDEVPAEDAMDEKHAEVSLSAFSDPETVLGKDRLDELRRNGDVTEVEGETGKHLLVRAQALTEDELNRIAATDDKSETATLDKLEMAHDVKNLQDENKEQVSADTKSGTAVLNHDAEPFNVSDLGPNAAEGLKELTEVLGEDRVKSMIDSHDICKQKDMDTIWFNFDALTPEEQTAWVEKHGLDRAPGDDEQVEKKEPHKMAGKSYRQSRRR